MAFRQFFSTFGALVAFGIGFGLFFNEGPDHAHGQFRVEAYGPFALCLAVLMVSSIVISAWGTQSQVPRLPQLSGPPERVTVLGSISRMFREIALALSNRSFRWLFAGVLIVFTMVGVDSALNLHMNTYFWELSSRDNIAWPQSPEIRTAADVPPETLMWLGLVYGPIVAGFAVVSVWCYSKYQLDRHRHAQIVAELDRRRAAASPAIQVAAGGG